MNLQSILLIGMMLSSNVANGTIYYETVYKDEVEQKEEIYLEQVKENPDDVEALTQLGNYYERLWEENDYDFENFYKAEEVYKKIIEINPESVLLADFYLKAEYMVGYYYGYDDGDEIELYKIAEDEFLRLLEIYENDAYLLISLGNLYSYNYSYGWVYTGEDDFSYFKFFDDAEKAYLEAIKADENNIYARYKLIDLYEEQWKNDRYFQDVDDNEYFEKIEQQHLEIIDIDKDLTYHMYELLHFYRDSYSDKDVDCVDKIEKQFAEISKIETDEEFKAHTANIIGDTFEDKWSYPDYTDNDAFEKAEYYYKYALDIEPDNSRAQYKLATLYEDGYYYGNINKEEHFKNAEQFYKEYSLNPDRDYEENISYYLADLYEHKWLENKSDYTYYYMAESELYNALDFELDLEANDIYSYLNPIDFYIYLAELYIAKYEFDGDVDAVNKGKNLLLEEISTTYSDEVSYMDNETQDNDVIEKELEKLEELGKLYFYVWKLEPSDMQYYEKAEKIFLKSQDIQNGNKALFQLGELYTERWLFDKSDVEYKIKAIQCLNEVINDDCEFSNKGLFMDDIYLLLEKLEL